MLTLIDKLLSRRKRMKFSVWFRIKTITKNGAIRYRHVFARDYLHALRDVQNEFAGTKWIVVPFGMSRKWLDRHFKV